MDYSADPSNNTKPNQHDYDELVIIYSHADAAAIVAPNAPVSSGQDEDMEGPSAWGNPVHFEKGRADVYERELGGGNKVLTRVLWVE